MPASGKASEAPNPASGPPSPTPFAFFDPSSCSWKTSPPSCAAGSTSSTPIWPRSGTTRAGSAYAHPTSGRHTAVTGCSCWPPDETSSASTAVTTLPTPCARDGKGPGMQRGLPDLIERRPLGVGPGRAGQLLPTPTSGGGTGYLSGNHRDTWGPTLELAVQGYRPSKLGRPGRPEEPALLPTPTAHAYGSNQSLSAGAAVRPSLASLAARRLLPTPRTSDARGPAHHGEGGADLRTVVWLLPTPKATDGTKGCPAQRGSKGDLTLPSAAVRLDPDAAGHSQAGGPAGGGPAGGGSAGGGRLLPTPRVAATRTARHAAISPASRSRPSLEQAAEIAEGTLPRELGSWDEAPAAWQPPAQPRIWGPYAQAVARWEHLLGRPAPTPTQPGKHGKPVLAPAFVEWLMGLSIGSAPGGRSTRCRSCRPRPGDWRVVVPDTCRALATMARPRLLTPVTTATAWHKGSTWGSIGRRLLRHPAGPDTDDE